MFGVLNTRMTESLTFPKEEVGYSLEVIEECPCPRVSQLVLFMTERPHLIHALVS